MLMLVGVKDHFKNIWFFMDREPWYEQSLSNRCRALIGTTNHDIYLYKVNITKTALLGKNMVKAQQLANLIYWKLQVKRETLYSEL